MTDDGQSMDNAPGTLVLADPRTRDQEERELKFVLPEARVDLVRRRLSAICTRDAEFPSAIVWTIYYDTHALSSLGEKINSDYLKRKIRVRWYSGPDGQPTGPAFVEAKLRVGNRRSKVRTRLPYSAEDLSALSLQDPRLRALPTRLREHGISVGELWEPVMLIRYRRDRFIEPLSGSRVSLDADIAGVEVNPTFLASADVSAVGVAVVEIKGASDELPMAMRALLQLGLRKRSFSKFLAVYSHMTRRTL